MMAMGCSSMGTQHLSHIQGGVFVCVSYVFSFIQTSANRNVTEKLHNSWSCGRSVVGKVSTV